MELGLFMMPLHPSYRAPADCYDRDIDQLVAADRLGFREAWLGEHFTEKMGECAGARPVDRKSACADDADPFRHRGYIAWHAPTGTSRPPARDAGSYVPWPFQLGPRVGRHSN